jgi:hypothetical protein
MTEGKRIAESAMGFGNWAIWQSGNSGVTVSDRVIGTSQDRKSGKSKGLPLITQMTLIEKAKPKPLGAETRRKTP